MFYGIYLSLFAICEYDFKRSVRIMFKIIINNLSKAKFKNYIANFINLFLTKFHIFYVVFLKRLL